MKLFEIVKEVTKKITTKFLEIIAPIHKILKTKQAGQNLEEYRLRGRRVKKRQSFNSFLKENPDLSKSLSLRKHKKVKRNYAFPKKQHNTDQLNDSLKSSNSPDSNGQGRTSNILLPQDLLIETSPLFTDTNGLQISAIQSKQNQVQQLNNSAESDLEILKFVFGEEQRQKNIDNILSLQPRKPSKSTMGANDKRQWWRKIIEKPDPSFAVLNERYSFIEELQAESDIQLNSSFESKRSKKIKTKKIKHSVRPKQSKKATITVINIIDLVQNENLPKLFQIPLAKRQNE